MERVTRASGRAARLTAKASAGTSTVSTTTASGGKASDAVRLRFSTLTRSLRDALTNAGGIARTSSSGKGTFYWKNGSYYVGKWRDDKPVGQGVHWCSSTKSKTKREWSNEFLCCCATTSTLVTATTSEKSATASSATGGTLLLSPSPCASIESL
jgi:hypothetical protein